MSIEPDTKDWTWVLEQRCPECGFEAAAVDRAELAGQLRDDARGWAAVLSQPGAAERAPPRTRSSCSLACSRRSARTVRAW